MACLAFTAWALWHLGYPEQALWRSHEALTLAQELSHPHSEMLARYFVSVIHQLRREVQTTHMQAEVTRNCIGSGAS